MNDPLVSVVVPTHNYAPYLTEAIESVLSQDYSRLEIIVIDDGSTDDTPAIVESLREPRVVYSYQESRGPGSARNRGTEMARGELIAFLDADDAWLPGKISAQIARFRAHPELGLVGSWGFDCDSWNRPTGLRKTPSIVAAMSFERLLVRNFIVPSGVMVRKRCLVEVGGFNDHRHGEDWDLWLRIARRFPIGFVQEPLFKRRTHAGALSFEIGDRLLASYRAIGETHLVHAQPPWMRSVLRQRLHSTALYYAAAQGLGHSRWRAVRMLLVALSLDPITLGRAKVVLLLRAVLPDRLFTRLRAFSMRPAGGLPERLWPR